MFTYSPSYKFLECRTCRAPDMDLAVKHRDRDEGPRKVVREPRQSRRVLRPGEGPEDVRGRISYARPYRVRALAYVEEQRLCERKVRRRWGRPLEV